VGDDFANINFQVVGSSSNGGRFASGLSEGNATLTIENCHESGELFFIQFCTLTF
jgi:hypothetical protein